MNEKNLIPNNRRTESERRAMAVQGGKASGEARRRRAELRLAFGVEPLTKEKMKEADAVLLNMNEAELRKMSDDKNAPTYLRRRARLLLNKSDAVAVDVAEKMLDRAFGKPRQEIDADIRADVPIRLMDDHLDE